MNKKNDLIRRGDAEFEISSLIGSVSESSYIDAINAINNIPAVTSEPVGYIDMEYYNQDGYRLICDTPIKSGMPVYTTPQSVREALEMAAKLLEQSASPFDEACTIVRALVDKEELSWKTSIEK